MILMTFPLFSDMPLTEAFVREARQLVFGETHIEDATLRLLLGSKAPSTISSYMTGRTFSCLIYLSYDICHLTIVI